MSNHLIALDGHASDAAVGGKAAALDRMIALGLAVPPSTALDIDAYRSATATGLLHDAIERWRSESLDDVTDHERARGDVDDTFAAAPLPDSVAEALVSVTDLIGPGPYAVRSSATAEDLDDASFAGQYESLLGVSEADLGDAVRSVWASLWHPAPR